MKKATFLTFLLTSSFGLFAQDFPAPYCEIGEDGYLGVEEITEINFNGTTISNTSNDSVLLDFTSTIVDVENDQSYDIEVKGNSYSTETTDYDNEYAAYIDWNQNNILDDQGEVTYIGKITGSDGIDGQSAIISVNVPADAPLGNTRIRIIKAWTINEWDAYWFADPCGIMVEDTFYEEISSTYGQALDFTLNVTTLGINKFDSSFVKVYPNPVKNTLTIDETPSVDETSIYNLQGQLVLSSKGKNQIDVSSLATGQYLVKIKSGGITKTSKFIKQ